jgi:hypothetical protein
MKRLIEANLLHPPTYYQLHCTMVETRRQKQARQEREEKGRREEEEVKNKVDKGSQKCHVGGKSCAVDGEEKAICLEVVQEKQKAAEEAGPAGMAHANLTRKAKHAGRKHAQALRMGTVRQRKLKLKSSNHNAETIRASMNRAGEGAQGRYAVQQMRMQSISELAEIFLEAWDMDLRRKGKENQVRRSEEAEERLIIEEARKRRAGGGEVIAQGK